ncbi:hypothetical protein [Streptomyces ficellus]|uniref:Uncharacterized protein n=1 Tax=Streptomyces ficellus TaxID=1977088 RepID=A0A6I6FQ43_9ACTN|nr:hypothetical protein [Streptomyces ficellus]QGV79728.1 hypothetical protein EIZ62_16865 [Streptomyces ficellus]
MRREGLIGITAVALCLGGVLTACGNGAGESRVATGSAGHPAGSAPVPPSGEVVLVPLDAGPVGEAGSGGGGGGTRPSAPPLSAAPPSRAPSVPAPARTATPGSGAQAGSAGPAGTPSQAAPEPGGSAAPAPPAPQRPRPPLPPEKPHEPQPPEPRPTPPPAPQPPPAPAALAVGEPLRAPGDRRWCEKVTVTFRNTGGSPVRSGTATFATHIIGALGVDWATIESRQPLPAPIAAGASRTQTYTVCVDAWRVPLGMHMETQDVSASWE